MIYKQNTKDFDIKTELIIQNLIASGGMGDVYEALLVQDNGFRKKIAAKKLKPELQHKKSIIIQEAKIQASLNHPNICTVFDIQEQNNEIYLLTEYLEGQTLKQKILDHKFKKTAFKKSDVEKILKELVSALKYAHDLGVVHRDLSASNIFITHSNTVKLIDFGLAEEDVQHNETQYTKTISGSLEYLSPERVDGLVASFKSDYFSVGIVLYEMLTLNSPFKKDSDFKTLESIKYEQIKTDLINTEFENFKIIVEGLLNKKPNERFNFKDVFEYLTVSNSTFSVPRLNTKSISFILLFITLSTSIFLYFRSHTTHGIVFKDSSNMSKVGPLEKESYSELSIESCSLFYREIMSYPDMIFIKPERNNFLNGKIKRTYKQAAYEISNYFDRKESEFNAAFDACQSQKINSKFRDRFNIYKNEIKKIKTNTEEPSQEYLTPWQTEIDLDQKYLFIEPYPKYFEYEAALSKVIDIFKFSMHYTTKEDLIFIENERIPEFLNKKACSDIGSGLWVAIFLTGNYALTEIENVQFAIYNPKYISIKKIDEMSYSITRKENYTFCHFKKTSFTASEAIIY